jgi:hypothetical protein
MYMRLKSQAEVPGVGQQGSVSPLSIFRGDVHGENFHHSSSPIAVFKLT